MQRKTVEQEKDGQNNGNEVFQNQIFSPAEMRMRMMGELQKREEIFSCELELQQLEQSHAMKAASQAMQQYVMQNEVKKRKHKCFQCLALPCLTLTLIHFILFFNIRPRNFISLLIFLLLLFSSLSSLSSLFSYLL